MQAGSDAPASSGGGSGGGRAVRSGSADAPKSSVYKGVSWHKHSQKWYAYIQAGGKMRGLGYFDCQEDAARAYDAEARKVRGGAPAPVLARPPPLACRCACCTRGPGLLQVHQGCRGT